MRARRQITRLTFVPGLALIGGAFGSIPGALAQTSFSSFGQTPQNSSSSGQSTDQTVAATTQAAQRAQAGQTVTTIQSHIRDVVLNIVRGQQRNNAADGDRTGLAAGSEGTKFATWADVSGSDLKNDAGGTFSYQGWAVTGVAGLDAVIDETWIMGLSAGYQRADFTVPSLGNGQRHNSGPLVGPYVSYIIDPHFSVDGSVTYATLENDVDTIAVPVNTRHFGSRRWTFAVNGNYYRDIGPISFTGFAGYTYSYEHQNAFTDSAGGQFTTAVVRYGAWKLGGEVSYPTGNFEPYIPFTYEHETTSVRDGTGRKALVLGVGLRYNLTDALKLGLLATGEAFHDHMSDRTIGANLRFNF